MSLLAALAVCGCQVQGKLDLLESQLRRQEGRQADLESKLAAARIDLAVSRKEADALQAQLAGRGEKTILPEQADVLYRATGIQFNKLMTGGLDRDNRPGDELLTAVLVPHDADGELVKLPGTIQLEVFDLTKSGDRQRIGRWEFSVEKSRDLWHRGWIRSGYLFKLPWQEIPESSELLLHARLTTVDGRQFDTSQTIRITPPHTDAEADGKNKPEMFGRIGGEKNLGTLSQQHAAGSPDKKPVVLRTSDSWTDQTIPQYR